MNLYDLNRCHSNLYGIGISLRFGEVYDHEKHTILAESIQSSSKDRIISALGSFTLRFRIVYFQSEDRTISVKIEYLNCDSSLIIGLK